MVKISVVMPAYNEEATILTILERVRSQQVEGVIFEVVVVDDGSRDRTVELLRGRPELYDVLICCGRNGGKGAAVIRGLEAATGEYVLFQDADLEYDPADYSGLLLPVTRFRPDIVMGSRFATSQFTRVHFFWHKLGNQVITTLFNLCFNTTFTDIYTCYLVFRRDLLAPGRLRTRGWEQQAEILARCVKAGERFYEVPISYNGRSYEEGKKIRWHHVVGVIRTILWQRFSRG